MKRKVIDREALRALYPPVDEGFERDMRHMLRTLPEREEQPMKKKSLTAVVLAAALIVALAATAVAAVFSRAFYEDVADMEHDIGYYTVWTLEEKQRMIGMMVDHGVIGEDDALAKLRTGSGEAVETQIDALMTERYGRADAITLVGMLEKELGELRDWSQEDKAWYSQVLLDSGLIGDNEEVFMMPGEQDIPPEEAVRIALDAVTDANGLARGALDGSEIHWDFRIYADEMDTEKPHYEVQIEGEISALVYISGDGRILGEADGEGYQSPWEAAEAERAAEQARAMGPEPLLRAHREGMAPLEAQEIAIDAVSARSTSGIVDEWGSEQFTPSIEKDVWVRSAAALADGGMLMTGLADGQAALFSERVTGERVPFAAVIEPTGAIRFVKPLVGRSGTICGGAQDQDGTLLMLLEEETDGASAYIQIRMTPAGEIVSEDRLPAQSDITGRREEGDHFWMVGVGHGGMVVSCTSGPDNDVHYTQLDAQARPVFSIVVPQKDEFTPRITVTDTGYLLTGYDKASGMPFMRRYDMQGKQTGEDVMLPELAGLKLNIEEIHADGTVRVKGRTEFSAKTSTIAILTADGQARDKWEIEEDFSVESVSCRLPSGERIEARLHRVSDALFDKHLCIARGEKGETLCYPLGADTGYWMIHGIAPVGEDKVMVIVRVSREEELGGNRLNCTRGIAAVIVNL